MTKIAEIISTNGPTISYEFFPPKSPEQAQNLDQVVTELAATSPDFISITYGAGGSTRATTRDTVIDHNRRWEFPTMAHLTCAEQTEEEIVKLLEAYEEGGVQNILALRGDGEPGDLGYALDLVNLIRDRHPDMSVGVAAHPEVHPKSPGRALDRLHLAIKLREADFAITQFFFDPEQYARLRDELSDLDCDRPIIPGIMLFSSAAGLRRMADMNNTSIPDSLNEALDRLEKSEDVGRLALDTAVALAHDLQAQGAPGLHIYTLNRSQPAANLVSQLAQKP